VRLLPFRAPQRFRCGGQPASLRQLSTSASSEEGADTAPRSTDFGADAPTASCNRRASSPNFPRRSWTAARPRLFYGLGLPTRFVFFGEAPAPGGVFGSNLRRRWRSCGHGDPCAFAKTGWRVARPEARQPVRWWSRFGPGQWFLSTRVPAPTLGGRAPRRWRGPLPASVPEVILLRSVRTGLPAPLSQSGAGYGPAPRVQCPLVRWAAFRIVRGGAPDDPIAHTDSLCTPPATKRWPSSAAATPLRGEPGRLARDCDR